MRRARSRWRSRSYGARSLALPVARSAATTTSPGPGTQTSTVPAPPPEPVEPTAVPTATTELPAAAVSALQSVLAGEHAVVWAYGVLGARLVDDARAEALALAVEHARARDALRTVLVGAGTEPVPARPSYALPVEPTDAASAVVLAALVEERLCAVYADLVAASTALALRTLGVDGVVTATSRVARWRGAAPTFPGMPERGAPTAAPTATPTGPTTTTSGGPAPTTS